MADSVPGQGGAVLAPWVSVHCVQHRGVGEAGDHRDQGHQQHRGQHGGLGLLGFSKSSFSIPLHISEMNSHDQ